MMADQSTDGWLCTRNKRKIPADSIPKSKRRKSLVSRRPPGSRPPPTCFTFTQNSPPPTELFTHTRQTSINKFFQARDTSKIHDDCPNKTNQCDEGVEELNFTCLYEDNSEFADSCLVKNSPPEVESSEKGSNPETSFVAKCLRLSDSDERVILSEINNNDCDTNQRQTSIEFIHTEKVSVDAKENINFSPNSVPIVSIEVLKTNEDLSKTISCDFKCEPPIVCADRKHNCDVPRNFDKNLTLSTAALIQSPLDSSEKNDFLENSADEFGCEVNTGIGGNASRIVSERSALASTSEIFSEQFTQDDTENTIDSLSLEMSLKSTQQVPDNNSEPFTLAFLSQDPTLRTRGITSVGLLGAVKGNNSELPTDDFTLTENFTDLNTQNSQISDIDLALDSQTFHSDGSDSSQSDSEFISFKEYEEDV